jgi:hypothetical protein
MLIGKDEIDDVTKATERAAELVGESTGQGELYKVDTER